MKKFFNDIITKYKSLRDGFNEMVVSNMDSIIAFLSAVIFELMVAGIFWILWNTSFNHLLPISYGQVLTLLIIYDLLVSLNKQKK